MNTPSNCWRNSRTRTTRTWRWAPPITSSEPLGRPRFCSWFGGIHGDKKLGMEQLGKTVDGGRYLQPFAKILLALAARREKQNAVAQKLLARTERGVSRESAVRRGVRKGDGPPIPAEMHP